MTAYIFKMMNYMVSSFGKINERAPIFALAPDINIFIKKLFFICYKVQQEFGILLVKTVHDLVLEQCVFFCAECSGLICVFNKSTLYSRSFFVPLSFIPFNFNRLKNILCDLIFQIDDAVIHLIELNKIYFFLNFKLLFQQSFI